MILLLHVFTVHCVPLAIRLRFYLVNVSFICEVLSSNCMHCSHLDISLLIPVISFFLSIPIFN